MKCYEIIVRKLSFQWLVPCMCILDKRCLLIGPYRMNKSPLCLNLRKQWKTDYQTLMLYYKACTELGVNRSVLRPHLAYVCFGNNIVLLEHSYVYYAYYLHITYSPFMLHRWSWVVAVKTIRPQKSKIFSLAFYWRFCQHLY